MRRVATLWTFVVVALGLATLAPRALADGPAAGDVRFFMRLDSSFDRFTAGADPSVGAWLRDKVFRAQVWSPYFDDKTTWYRNGLASKDLYAIYADDTATVTEHSEWILRDADGKPLYIPWGCSAGSCPQYAADVGSPAFRQAWIDQARDLLAHGYRGLWIDDVNLEFRVGDGAGRWRAPIDPRTGVAMTTEDWRRYVAEFVEQIRSAFPSAEIMHNVIWFAAQPARAADPYVRREIAAADRVNLERGVNDPGLTGGTGPWSLKAFLGYVDDVHAAGRSVVLDGFDGTASGREYDLAAYFLVSEGDDGIGLSTITPDAWWSMYDVHLGRPLGRRFAWNGLMRRDFEDGVVLVDEPGASEVTAPLGAAMLDADGDVVSSVTLRGGSGAVLRRIPSAASPAQASVAPANPSAATPRASRTTPAAVRSKGGTALRLRSVATSVRCGRGRGMLVHGVVVGGRAGRVSVDLRPASTSHRRSRHGSTSLRGNGRFRKRLCPVAAGRYRLQVRYRGIARAGRTATRSRWVRVG